MVPRENTYIYIFSLMVPHGNIECGPAPVLDGVQVGEVVSYEWRDLQQVVGPNPGCKQRLVGIPRMQGYILCKILW